jgi:hypothetical protein
VQEEIESRGLVTVDAVREELLTLSEIWRGSWEGMRNSVKKEGDSRWGVAGITAHTSDPEASFRVAPSVDYYFSTSKVDVYYVADKHSFVPEVVADSGNVVLSAVYSPTHASFTFAKPANSFSVRLSRTTHTQEQFILQGLMLDNHDEAGIIYSSVGVNGAKVPSFLMCEDLIPQLRQLRPDLVIISLGTNDTFYEDFDPVQFKQDYRTLISRVKKARPEACILLTTPNDNLLKRKFPNPDLPKAKRIVRLLAKEMNLALWDFHEVMGGAGTIQIWQKHKLAQNDFVHLTKTGYEVQGRLFYGALMSAYERYKQALHSPSLPTAKPKQMVHTPAPKARK